MASYKRPLSKAELRFIRRQKVRIIVWCGVLVCFVLAVMIGMFLLLARQDLH
jgi:hypothetical protein